MHPRGVRVALTAIALAASACASAPRNPVLDRYPAGVAGRTTIDYYDVHGSTFAELQADLRRLGPRIGVIGYVAETRSPMEWSWRVQRNGAGACSIHEVTVSVNAQILLPRWTPPADTEPGLVTEWTRFIAALEAHEAGHKDISAKAGRDIVAELRRLTAPCSQINSEATMLAKAIADRTSDEQKAYDARTQHGLTQGTGFGAGRH